MQPELHRVNSKRRQRGCGQRQHHERLVGKVDVIEKPERRASVLDVREFDPPGDDGVTIAQRQAGANERLCNLVGDDNRGHNGQFDRSREQSAGGHLPDCPAWVLSSGGGSLSSDVIKLMLHGGPTSAGHDVWAKT